MVEAGASRACRRDQSGTVADTEHGTAHAARVPGNEVVPGFPKQRNPVGVALVEKLLGDGIEQFGLA